MPKKRIIQHAVAAALLSFLGLAYVNHRAAKAVIAVHPVPLKQPPQRQWHFNFAKGGVEWVATPFLPALPNLKTLLGNAPNWQLTAEGGRAEQIKTVLDNPPKGQEAAEGGGAAEMTVSRAVRREEVPGAMWGGGLWALNEPGRGLLADDLRATGDHQVVDHRASPPRLAAELPRPHHARAREPQGRLAQGGRAGADLSLRAYQDELRLEAHLQRASAAGRQEGRQAGFEMMAGGQGNASRSSDLSQVGLIMTTAANSGRKLAIARADSVMGMSTGADPITINTGQAGIELDENFNELTPQKNATDVGAFMAVAGLPDSVDIVTGAECAPPESGNCVQLNGAGFGRLQSKMTFSPGQYFLSFDLISPPGVTTNTTVSLGDTRLVLKLGPGDDTTGIVTNQLATVGTIGSPQLFIASDTFGPTGALLDNVVVSTTPFGVPEPATFGLLALGIAGGGFAARRRR